MWKENLTKLTTCKIRHITVKIKWVTGSLLKVANLEPTSDLSRSVRGEHGQYTEVVNLRYVYNTLLHIIFLSKLTTCNIRHISQNKVGYWFITKGSEFGTK